MRVRHLGNRQHRSAKCTAGLLLLMSALMAPRLVEADDSQSRFDDINFVRISAGCRMAGDHDSFKMDDTKGTFVVLPGAVELLCDGDAISKQLTQLLHAGLLKPASGQDRSREEIVKNAITWAPVGGARELSIGLGVLVSDVMEANQSAPIQLCTYVLVQRISGSHTGISWMQSGPLTVVCGSKSDVAAAGIAFAKPILLDTIAQLRRAK